MQLARSGSSLARSLLGAAAATCLPLRRGARGKGAEGAAEQRLGLRPLLQRSWGEAVRAEQRQPFVACAQAEQELCSVGCRPEQEPRPLSLRGSLAGGPEPAAGKSSQAELSEQQAALASWPPRALGALASWSCALASLPRLGLLGAGGRGAAAARCGAQLASGAGSRSSRLAARGSPHKQPGSVGLAAGLPASPLQRSLSRLAPTCAACREGGAGLWPLRAPWVSLCWRQSR